MSTIKKIAGNSGIIIFGNMAETLFNFAISIFLARYFGQSGFGKLSFLATFFFFLGTIDNQWIRPILVREISRDPAGSADIIGNGLIMKTCISILSVIAFWITVWIVSPISEIVTLAIFTSINLLITSLVSSYVTIFQVKLKMAYFVAFNLLNKMLILLLIYTVMLWKGTLFHFYVLSLIPAIILLLQVKYRADKMIRPEFKINFKLWKKIFRESWPLGLTAFFIFIYHRLDHLILFRINGPAMAGLYAASTRLTESFTIIPVALMTSVLPLMSRYYETSRNEFQKIYRLSFKYLLAFIIPMAIGTTIFSDRIVMALYGKEFLPSGLILRILIWAEVFVFMGVVNNSILVSINYQKLDPVFTGLSAAINIILNLILIPRYSVVGAAVASLISYAVGPVMGYFIPVTAAYSYCMLRYSLKPLFASLFMACFIYCMRNYFLVSVFISPLVYLFALYLLKGITAEDVSVARSITQR